MHRYEIRNGTTPDATLIGIVHALDESEAISTLNAYRNGFGVTDPGKGVPAPYVEWAHDRIKDISVARVPSWTAHRA